MTGAYGMLQPQQTGFPGQQPMYPQQTGMYNQFQQRQVSLWSFPPVLPS